mmetsp:Transcript_36954/g.77195  ORF Transcript_36954/g.77195 Transcript_36954/m.77195 type:complete len:124 (-) Transcript_36954:54-425(-)
MFWTTTSSKSQACKKVGGALEDSVDVDVMHCSVKVVLEVGDSRLGDAGTAFDLGILKEEDIRRGGAFFLHRIVFRSSGLQTLASHFLPASGPRVRDSSSRKNRSAMLIAEDVPSSFGRMFTSC